MIRIEKTAAFSAAAVLLAGAAHATHLQVVLMAGQSNMVGGGWTRDLPPSQQHTFPEVMYAHDSRVGVPPEDWAPLQPRYNSGLTARRFFGPEIGFGEEMLARGVDNLAIIKVAAGGTSLATSWAPGADLREDFYSFVDQQLADLTTAGHTYDVSGFIWVQGSGDANSLDRAQSYDENLSQFIGELEGRYGEVTTVINRYHADSDRSYVPELRASQRAAADADGDVYVVHTDDLALQSDDIHFTTDMHLEVGRRLAERFLEASLPAGDYNRDGVIGVADFTVWRDTLDSLSNLAADGDGDGVVDADDWEVWRAATEAAGAANSVAGTPEPGAWALAVAAIAIAARRRAQRSPRETPWL